MRKVILAVAMLAMTSAVFAGPAATQLGSEAGVGATAPGVAMPTAPALDTEAAAAADAADVKSICHNHNNNFPGCPGYCQSHPFASGCRPPAYCHTNPNGYGCNKGVDDKSMESGFDLFDQGLAKANCAVNPGAPGCPLFCKDHHAYPGCPQFCQANPLHPACGHTPAYCQTNPNGYGCKKGADDKSVTGDLSFDESLAKANCAVNPGAPGCPLFCKDHHAYPGCPLFCQANPLHPACGHIPAYCHTNPNGYGCPKALDIK